MFLIHMIRDTFTLRVKQARRLFTHEDGRFAHMHKILGTTVLAHFVYRMYLWFSTGDMNLHTHSWNLLFLYMLHTLLHISSFEFHVPIKRNPRYNIIWAELRWHSLIFAYRSLAVLFLHWFQPILRISPHTITLLRGTFIILTMLSADYITKYYRKKNDSEQHHTSMTMRNNPYPEYAHKTFVYYLNLFYSTSQVFATLNILTSQSMDRVFMTLLAIQTAPFLMTLQKKGIITQAGWHFYYTLSLLANYMLAMKPMIFDNTIVETFGLYIPRQTFLLLGTTFATYRFLLRTNKYLLWSIIISYVYFTGKSVIYTT